MILAAIAPLPEDVPELFWLLFWLIGKIQTVENPIRKSSSLDRRSGICDSAEKFHRMFANPKDLLAIITVIIRSNTIIRFLNCKAIFHRKDAIYPATVVGKPSQEDFFIGDYLQEFLSPLFPLVMPAVKDLWSYGETGFHSLAAAVVKERYSREALGAGFRILGEGQLSLTKFLLLTDKPQDLRDFKTLFEYILERVNWESDFFIFDRTSFDTLDYASAENKSRFKGNVGRSRRKD